MHSWKVLRVDTNYLYIILIEPGTGKTLCLLCATLAWRKDHIKKLKKELRIQQDERLTAWTNEMETDCWKDDPMNTSARYHTLISFTYVIRATGQLSESQVKLPTIIYASRTHSQLTQVIKELKNTRYR